MNTPELHQLKMVWLAAQENGDTRTQLRLLQEHPAELEELVSFIAAYYATGGDDVIEQDIPLLPVTQKALQSALTRTFEPQPVLANLGELRKNLGLSKVDVAKGLRLSVDVWSKFEAGAIELVSLQQQQLGRLAQFFQVSIDQFSKLLNQSQPGFTLNRRQTRDAASQQQQGPQSQSFSEAITRSTMSKVDKKFWLE